MTPAAALEKQIEIYRRMTGEQRLAIALDLHELSCELAREGIRRQHPEADAAEVERLLRRRIELTRAEKERFLRALEKRAVDSPQIAVKVATAAAARGKK
jgi:hypothetical protein